MAGYVEVWVGGTPMVVVAQTPLTIGRAASNDVVFADDTAVSRLHAAVEILGSNWVIRDLSSRNGTKVNGDRLHGVRPLRHGDEILIGGARLVFRDQEDDEAMAATVGAEPPPELTRREADVLFALFAPALDAEVFTEPASTKDIAAALFVSEAAVKQHLTNLYGKFAIFDGIGASRRVRLANEALRRGAVTLAELRTRR